ncbi:MAG: hypothetical protein AAF547_14265 [Actinomycetota bacterium]
MKHHPSKRRAFAPILLLALLAPIVAIASPASANGSWTNKTEWYDRWSTKHFSDIDVCARVRVSGKITYSKYRSTRQARYTDIKVSNPRVRVYTYDRSGSTCTWTRKTVGKVNVVHRWSGYTCSFDPSIGVSFPWGVGVSGWAGCGNENQATRNTTYFANGSYYSQSNTGAPVTFGNVVYGQQSLNAGPCYGVYASVTIWNTRENASDFNNSTKKQICLD